MRVVSTAVKNHPSNRASFDWTARTQASKSVCTPPASPVVTVPVWRESDIEVGRRPRMSVGDPARGLEPQVLVLGVPLDPAVDERAEGDHPQPQLAGLVQGGAGQGRPDPAPLV